MAHWCERDGFTGNSKSSHWLWTAVISYSACTENRLVHYWNNPALSFTFIMTEMITQLAETGLLTPACMHVSESSSLTVCVCVCVCLCLCVCATWRTFLWLHYGEKMTPWPALGLLKRESTRHTYAHQQTHSWKTHTYTTKRNIFNAFCRARQARARSQRCPFFFPMCRCFHPRSPSSSKWMHNSACPPFLQTGGLEVQSRRMSGLPSNAVLMVPCVVGRERQLIEILRDSAERYIMGPFCRGRLVKSD